MVLVILMEGNNEESDKRKSTRATEQQQRDLQAEALETQYSVSHPIADWGAIETGYHSAYPLSFSFEGVGTGAETYHQRETDGAMLGFDRARGAFQTYHPPMPGERQSRQERKEEEERIRLQQSHSDETKEEDDRKPAARTSGDRLMEQLERSFPDEPHQEDTYYGDITGTLAPAPPDASYQSYAAMHPTDQYPPPPYRPHQNSHPYDGHSTYHIGVLDEPMANAAAVAPNIQVSPSNGVTAFPPGREPYASGYGFPLIPAQPAQAVARAVNAPLEPELELTSDRLYPSDEELTRAKHERDRKAITKWYERFRELLAFKQEMGHCAVPQKYPKNRQLGSWVNKMRDLERQRKQGKQNFLNNRMWENLRVIGFVSAKPKGDPLWLLRYNQLKEFYATKHHSNVPTKYAQNRALGRWTSTQRLQYRLYLQGQPSSMTRERIRLLEEVHFVWDAAPDRDGTGEEDTHGDAGSE